MGTKTSFKHAHFYKVCPNYQHLSVVFVQFDTFTKKNQLLCIIFVINSFFSKIRDLPYALQTADRLILKTTFVICTK